MARRDWNDHRSRLSELDKAPSGRELCSGNEFGPVHSACHLDSLVLVQIHHGAPGPPFNLVVVVENLGLQRLTHGGTVSRTSSVGRKVTLLKPKGSLLRRAPLRMRKTQPSLVTNSSRSRL